MAKATKNAEPEVKTPPTTSPTPVAAAPDAGQKPVRAAQFPEATEGQVKPSSGQFDLILDMDVSIAVMLGQTQIPIRRLLQLGPGAVVPLDKPVEAPVDLYLQGSKFAEGDVVVAEDRLGIRIRQVMGADGAESKAKV